MARKPAPPSYVDSLLDELDTIASDYTEILNASDIVNKDPNRWSHSVTVIDPQVWYWADSDPGLEAKRMALLKRVRDWTPRFRLLFPHPTPEVTERLEEHLGRMERWLVRGKDKNLPTNISDAHLMMGATFKTLRELTEMLPTDEYAVRVVVDTNTLIDNPDIAAHTATVGPSYMAHLLPVALRELDEHKRGGKTPDLREGAKKADRRLKGLRTNGNVRDGVKVSGSVYCVFEHIEPKDDNLPSWLDLDVPDDRFVASTLLIQSDHPGSAVYVATGDINLQTKLAAVGLPFVELP